VPCCCVGDPGHDGHYQVPQAAVGTTAAVIAEAMGLMRVLGGQTVDAKFWREVIDTLILPAVYAPVSTSRAPTRRSPNPGHAN
jgi:hypothetical protein